MPGQAGRLPAIGLMKVEKESGIMCSCGHSFNDHEWSPTTQTYHCREMKCNCTEYDGPLPDDASSEDRADLHPAGN